MLMARRTSPLASGSVLPSSRVISAATGLEVLVQDVGGLVEDVAARRSADGAPAGEGGRGGRGGRIDVGGGALDERADDLIGIGRIAIFKSGAGSDPLAVDVVSEH